MPGESLQRDLAEVLEFYGQDERCQIPAVALSTYLIRCLDAFRMAKDVRFPLMEKQPAQNAGATPDGEGVKVGAQHLSSLEVGSDDPEG